MSDSKVRARVFRGGTLVLWGLIQVAGVIVSYIVRPPASSTLPWVVFLTVLFTPFYVWLVHSADVKWNLGGLRSIKTWLDAKRQTAAPELGISLDSRERGGLASRARSGLALQAVTVTTGFAALLAFQTARFYKDLAKEDASVSPFLNTLLMIVATLFVVACIANLLQILLNQFLAQKIWDQRQQGSFRDRINILQGISWHFLVTPVILILCLLPWYWLCYAVNFFYGLSLHWYYFCLQMPDGFPNTGKSMNEVAMRSGGSERL